MVALSNSISCLPLLSLCISPVLSRPMMVSWGIIFWFSWLDLFIESNYSHSWTDNHLCINIFKWLHSPNSDKWLVSSQPLHLPCFSQAQLVLDVCNDYFFKTLEFQAGFNTTPPLCACCFRGEGEYPFNVDY